MALNSSYQTSSFTHLMKSGLEIPPEMWVGEEKQFIILKAKELMTDLPAVEES